MHNHVQTPMRNHVHNRMQQSGAAEFRTIPAGKSQNGRVLCVGVSLKPGRSCQAPTVFFAKKVSKQNSFGVKKSLSQVQLTQFIHGFHQDVFSFVIFSHFST